MFSFHSRHNFFFLVIINVIIIIIIITFRIIKFFLFRMEEKLIKNQIKYKNHPKPRKNQIINNNKKNTEKKIVNNNIFHTCWFVCCHNQFELKIQTKKNKISWFTLENWIEKKFIFFVSYLIFFVTQLFTICVCLWEYK